MSEKPTQKRVMQLMRYDQNKGHFIRIANLPNGVKAGEIAGIGGITTSGYSTIRIDGVRYASHRVVWLYMTGQWPSNQIDHINGNRTDNLWSNLRAATQSENAQNTSTSVGSKTGHQGVHFHVRDKTFIASICVDKKRKHIGSFKTLNEAVNARAAAKQELHKFNPIARTGLAEGWVLK